MDWLDPFKGAYGIQRRTKAVMNNTPVNMARTWNTASTYTAANNPTTAKGTVIFKLKCADRERYAFNRIALSVCPVVGWIDTPVITGAVVRCP